MENLHSIEYQIVTAFEPDDVKLGDFVGFDGSRRTGKVIISDGAGLYLIDEGLYSNWFRRSDFYVLR